MIYFAIYVHSHSIKILNLDYHELIGKIEEQEGKLMINNSLMNIY